MVVKMDKYFYKKVRVMLIILCLIGLNIIPSISGDYKIIEINEKKSANIYFENLKNLSYKNKKTNFNLSEIIQQYTWSVLRYGLRSNLPFSSNFGNIYYAKPSPGTSLILAAMMSEIACQTALSIYHESKKDTLLALEDFDIKNMIHTQTAFLFNKSEWNSPFTTAYRRETTDEMRILGNICFIGNLVGNCYAQASFNTAVLRMCGFEPEEVFNIGIQDHTVNIVKVEGQWYAIDSTCALLVRIKKLESIIFKFYNPPNIKMINFLENDKYFINFGTKYPDNYQNQDPYLFNLFSNMDQDILLEILEEILPLFNNSVLGIPEIQPLDFINQSIPCPEMKTISVPYTVNDAVGYTIEEKTQSLVNLTTSFIMNQSGNCTLNQYDKSLYVIGLLSVDYPQVYTNAAKYAAWTSFFGMKLDSLYPNIDLLKTIIWIRMYNKNTPILPEGYVAFSDLLYLRHAGSTIDQAIMGYGTIRNMKKYNNNLWQPDDLYVMITKDYNGYLAVKITNNWKYINFGKGKLISDNKPDNIILAFNEFDCLTT